MFFNYRFLTVILILIISGVLVYSPGKDECFCNHGYGIDAIEYHFIAANFALHSSFPVYGFLGEVSEYKLCKENTALAEYYTFLKNAGPVIFSGRPPLYPMVMGFVYKLAGFNPQSLYCLNFVSIWLTALLLAIALFVARGVIAAVVISAIYLFVTAPFAHINDAEAFIRPLYFLAILTLVWAEYKSKKTVYFIAGIAMVMALLSKGTILIFIILSFFFIFYMAIKNGGKTKFAIVFVYIFPIAIFIISWSFYINYQLDESKNERSNWAKYLSEVISDVSVEKPQDLFNDSTNWYSKAAVYYFIKIHQTRYVADSGFVVLTNQLNRSNILSNHNEYCLDGDYHPEFEPVSTSFHNRYSKETEWVWKSVARFYISNPVFAVQVFYAKICALGKTPTSLYFLSIVLTTLALCYKHQLISISTARMGCLAFAVLYYTALFNGVIHLVVWLPLLGLFISSAIIIYYAEGGWLSISTLLTLSFAILALVIYGDPRFVDALDAVWVFFTALALSLFFKKKHCCQLLQPSQ